MEVEHALLFKSVLGVLEAESTQDGTRLVRTVALQDLPAGVREGLLHAARWSEEIGAGDGWLEIVAVEVAGAEMRLVSRHRAGRLLATVLSDIRKRDLGMSASVTLRIACDLLEALAELHALEPPNGSDPRFGGVTPESIWVGADGRTRLMEIGVSSFASSRGSTANDAVRLRHRAPEGVGEADGCTAASDVFSVGTVLWELLMRRPLFDAEGAADVLAQILSDPIPSVTDTPDEVAELVARSLSRDMKERFADPLEMLGAIEACGAAVASRSAVADYFEEMSLDEGMDIEGERPTNVRDVRAFMAEHGIGPGAKKAAPPKKPAKPPVPHVKRPNVPKPIPTSGALPGLGKARATPKKKPTSRPVIEDPLTIDGDDLIEDPHSAENDSEPTEAAGSEDSKLDSDREPETKGEPGDAVLADPEPDVDPADEVAVTVASDPAEPDAAEAGDVEIESEPPAENISPIESTAAVEADATVIPTKSRTPVVIGAVAIAIAALLWLSSFESTIDGPTPTEKVAADQPVVPPPVSIAPAPESPSGDTTAIVAEPAASGEPTEDEPTENEPAASAGPATDEPAASAEPEPSATTPAAPPVAPRRPWPRPPKPKTKPWKVPKGI